MERTMVKKRAQLALALLLPVPTLGVIAGMILFPNTTLGAGLYFLAKTWLLLFPLAWHVFVNRKRLSWSPPRKGGFPTAALLGIGLSAGILIAYIVLGKALLDPAGIRAAMREVGLTRVPAYLACCVYWILVNSLLEEYVWRWFVVRESEKLVGSTGAIVLSALGFTIHHAVAMQIYFSPLSVAVASAGLFVGALAWSWCYVRYRSIWPGYVSHAIADLVVFGIGFHILFGGV